MKAKNEAQHESSRKKPPSSSSSSSSSQPPRKPKKTRDLPNLSECHACGFRIDTANAKQRLQTLYSEWRIVLLCNKCFLRVESSHICSYCFLESSAESFRCRDCNRCVHKDCFLKYRCVAPWSYSSCSGEEFSVCVDCWVPRPIAVSRSRKIRRKGKANDSCDELRDSRSRVLDDVVKDANSVAEKKIEAAVRAREEAVRKALMARKAVELATNALDLVVASRDENGDNEEDVIDDAELAFRLHRMMNSSPRITTNFCSMNTSCFAIPRICGERKGDTSVCGKLELCSDNKLSENLDKSVSEPSVCVRATDGNSSTNVDCLKLDAEDENVCVPMKEDEGSCSFKLLNSNVDDNSMDSANLSMPKDRYVLKYCRRNCRSKSLLDGKPDFSYNAFHLVNQASAAGLLISCSNESRAISSATFQCCAVPLQASGCASDSFQDHS